MYIGTYSYRAWQEPVVTFLQGIPVCRYYLLLWIRHGLTLQYISGTLSLPARCGDTQEALLISTVVLKQQQQQKKLASLLV